MTFRGLRVLVRDGQVETALREFKHAVQQEGVIRDSRRHMQFIGPAELRRTKATRARRRKRERT